MSFSSISFFFTSILSFAGVVISQQDGLHGIVSGATLFTGPAAPVINLGYASYQGKLDQTTNSANYLGLKYANAPRFDHATVFSGPVDGGVQDASEYGFSCPQQSVGSIAAPEALGNITGFLDTLPVTQPVFQEGEDCLSINVQRPQDESITGLPVMFWIHGGGFSFGSSASIGLEVTATSGTVYEQGARLVQRSLQMGQPMIFVSINYRLSDFGFSASQEMADAGLLNLGLEDQRVAMQWVQNNIAAFGGDPTKVSIMGSSAGAYSVSAHLVANGGNTHGLFRAAVGLSGGPVKVDGVDRQQALFDDMVNFVGCSPASDKIACLRQAPYEKLLQHIQTQQTPFGFRNLAVPWNLRPGGDLLSDSPDRLVENGNIANVPILYGDMADEGTLFSLVCSVNVTTDEEVKDYFKNVYWPAVTEDQLEQILQLYPDDPTQGSPFGTGVLYDLPPQYKRLAAIIGDYSFQSQRRELLAKHKAPKWNYLMEISLPQDENDPLGLGGITSGILGGSNLAAVPVLGSFHTAETTFNVFGTLPDEQTVRVMSTLISFVVNLDPNKHGLADLPNWPQWDSNGLATMHFRDLSGGPEIIKDDYREDQMKFFKQNAASLRV